MSDWMLWLQYQYELIPQFYQNLLLTLAVLVGLWLLRRWIFHLGTRRPEDARVRYSWRRTTNYICYISLAIALVFIWLSDLSNLATYIGLLSAGVATAFRLASTPGM